MSAALSFVVDRLKQHVVGESLVRRNPFYYGRARRLLDRLDAMDLEGRRAWTRAQLAHTLAAARCTSYGRVTNGTQDIRTWPLLDRELLRDRLHAFTTGNDWFASPANTGGTAGVPLKLVRSLDGVVFEQACIDLIVEGLGFFPRSARIATLRGDNGADLRTHSPEGLFTKGGRLRVWSAHAVTPDNVEKLADSVGHFAPEILCAYPSALEALCRLLAERGRHLTIPAVLTSSELLKPEAWDLARDVLGCRVADYYGQSERVAFAYAFEPREYRFLTGYSHVEFLPYDSSLLPADSPDHLYEIVGTTFWNRLMPLVRYRTGDLIRLPASWGETEREELALGLRSFSGILGREQEVLVHPHGIRLTGLDMIPQEVRHVLRIQVVQETLTSARIRVVPTREFNDDDAARLLSNVRARVPADVELSVETTHWLERTPRGKTPLIVHRTPVHEALRNTGIEPIPSR